jgi:hypothetical protein
MDWLLELAKAYGLWAAIAVFLVFTGWKREQQLMAFLSSVAPALEAANQKLSSVTAITERIESKVDSCDLRHEKRQMADDEERRRLHA